MSELYDELGMDHDDRDFHTYVIPLGLDSRLAIYSKFPMKEEEYNFMIQILTIMQYGLMKD